MRNFIEGLYLVRPKNVDHSSREHLEKNLKKGINIMGKLWMDKREKKLGDVSLPPNNSEENSDLRGSDLFAYSNET
jgi:hypothetical protein